MRHLLPAGRLLVCLAFACPAVAAPPALNCRDGKDALPRLQIVQNLWGLRAYPSAKAEQESEAGLEPMVTVDLAGNVADDAAQVGLELAQSPVGAQF